jgi:ABC-type branched-subunit amino acid transport system ATPase component
MVFVAGQAGSGKTGVVDLVHAALQRRGGAVRVDRDAYKAVRPRYTAFLAEDVRTAGDLPPAGRGGSPRPGVPV